MTLGSNTMVAVNENIPALKADIEKACQSNGAFVDIELAGNRTVSVLFTSLSQVSFEQVETVDDDVEEVDVTSGYTTDTDYWFE